MGRIIGAKDAITGGTISSAGGYRIHTFTDVGTSQFNMSMLPSAINIEYLIIAGGGGSLQSYPYSGGGGAGGYRSGTISSSPANYSVSVGFGGFSGTSISPGGNSSFNGIVSLGGGSSGWPGGGGGNSGPTIPATSPQSGGSGAGGTAINTGFGATSPTYIGPGAGTAGQGFAGGNAIYATGNPPSARFAGTNLTGTYLSAEGGGGGAGGVGGNGVFFDYGIGVGGTGGAGMSSSITGTSTVRASGGGGHGIQDTTWGNTSEAAQTPGGGGRSYYSNLYGAGATTGYRTFATPGTPNTGGGSGGGQSWNGTTSPELVGGSGIVILRYTFP